MTQTQTLSRTRTATPERWRNKWRAVSEVGGCSVCGFWCAPGEAYFECCLPAFATKAEAEADAIYDITVQISRHGRLTDEWLGAFKET